VGVDSGPPIVKYGNVMRDRERSEADEVAEAHARIKIWWTSGGILDGFRSCMVLRGVGPYFIVYHFELL